MIRTVGATLLLTLAAAMPAQQATAQDILGGALLGGAAGAIIGGAATGRGSGAAIGAVIGAGTGAAIAANGQQRRAGYYWYEGRCWLRHPNGSYERVSGRYCG
jgi:uncharacterized protein YcfJ